MRLSGVVLVAAIVTLGLAERTAFAFCQVGELCHMSQGLCDSDTFCQPNGQCPTTSLLPSTTQCAGPTDLCDKPEFCTGTSPNCPAGGPVQAAGFSCRAAAGDCDVADVCDGVSPSCPNTFLSATTPCRNAVLGGCDITENCTGSSPTCPADVVEPNTKTCRPAVLGGCDVAEQCTGSSPSCPADVVEPSTKVCRQIAAGTLCDVAEKCNGTAATCPADGFASSATVCRPAVAGGCDVQEKCPGNAAACPADVFQPENQGCSDGNACTVGDACHAGACVAGDPPLVADMVDFGPALVGGAPRTAMLMLQWRDTGNVAVTALSSSSSEFRLAASQQLPIALSPAAATASVAMEFLPTSLGARSATLTATIDPATCAVPMIDLVGTGSPPGLIADPAGTDFARVDVGTTSAAKTFRIINLSGAEAILQTITVSDASNFALTADGLPATMAVDGSYSFTVAAKPQTGGVHRADVMVVSNGTSNPMLSVQVEGTCAGVTCVDDPGPGSGDPGGPDPVPGEPGGSKVSPLSCGVQRGGAGAAWIVLAVLVARRRRAPETQRR